MGLESQSTINPCHINHVQSKQISPQQLGLNLLHLHLPLGKLGMSCVRISLNLLNQPIKCFFDFLESCFSNRPNWNMQQILECFVILINIQLGAGRRIQKSPNGTSDFFILFRSMANKLSKQELKSWAMVVWAIWGA